MVNIKSLDLIAEKYGRVTPGRSADYEAGIRNPARDWEDATAKAESNWESGVQAAISKKQFGKGVHEAGTSKWQKKALELGTARWGPGVTAAVDDYKSGFSKYHSVIERLTLTPRKEVGNPQNYRRVQEIGEALRRAKVGS